MNRHISRPDSIALGGICFLLAMSPMARSADVLFKNTPVTVSLTNNLNWDGDVLPGSGEMATWGAAVGGTSLGGSLTWASNTTSAYQGIKVVDASANIALSSAGGATSLTLGSGGIDMSAATRDLSIHDSSAASTTLGITLGAAQAWNVGPGRTLGVGNSDTTITLNNDLMKTGAGTFNLGGSGVTTLTGSGVLEINGGVFNNNMQTGSSSAGRTGATTLTSGTISIATTISMFGSGAINLNGGAMGSANANGRDLGAGNAVNFGGNVQIGGSSGGLGSGYVRFGGATDLGGAVRTITAVASGVLASNGAGAIFNGIVSNGGITKEGSGYLTLGNNSNTFSGATTINTGNLAFSQKALAASSSITLANSGVNLVIGENGAGTHDINNLGGVSGSTIRSDFTFSGTNTARALKVTQTVDGTFAGSFLEGSGGRTIALEKAGSATLTLTGTGTFTGATTVGAGTLKIGGGGLLGSATYAGTITNDATLHFDSTAGQVLSGGMSGAGTLRKSSSAVLRLTGTNSFSGLIDVQAGDVVLDSLGSENGAPDVNMSGGRFLLSSPFAGQTATIGNLTGTAGTINPQYNATTGVRTLQVNQTTNGVFGGNIQDGGGSRYVGLTKTGSASLTLSGGANNYSGTTTIADGTLVAQGGSAIGDLSTVELADLATASLQVFASEQVGALSGGGVSGGNIILASGITLTIGNNDASTTYGGVISGVNASLLKRGGGNQELSGGNTFTGGVTIQNGTLTVPSVAPTGTPQGLGQGGSAITFTGSGTLAVTGSGTLDRGLVLADASSDGISVGGTVTHTGSITGGNSSTTFTKAGAGTFNQAGAGSWSGNVFLTQGAYNVTSTGSIGNAGVIQLTGGSTFNISTTTQVRASSIQIVAGTVNLNAGTLRTNGISMASGTAFNWSAGTVTMQADAAGSSGVTDRRAPGSSLSAQPVYEGRIIDITGAAAAITVPDGGTLDLGPTYGSFGMRYDQLHIAGSLDLTAPGSQTLHFEFNPFFFRPSAFGADGAGTLILIDSAGFVGSGTFEDFTGVLSDYIGFSAAPGSGTIVGTLGMSTLNPLTDIPANTYYLEYETDTGNVLFHYRLTATIPEPASASLIAMGALMLRVMRRRRVV